jgi:SAM-dependent methyltransferase
MRQARDAGGMAIYSSETSDLLASQQRDPLLRFLTDRVVSSLKTRLPPGSRVLDVGCGIGRTSLALAQAGYQVDGVDPSPRAVELARAHAEKAWREREVRADRSALEHGPARAAGASSPRATAVGATPTAVGPPRFSVGDATMPIAAEWRGQFDGVVCSEVIEHVDRPEAVLAFCADALRSGGWAVVTTPHQRRQWTAMDTYAGHVTRFETDEVESLLSGRFRIERLETEGFPFQRTAMRLYDATLKAGGQRHEYEGIRDRPAYRAYVTVMPWLLRVDHLLAGLRRGTTIVAVAQRSA